MEVAGNAEDILEGVQELIAEVGESFTLTRTTTVRDPLNPTKVTTTTTTYTGACVVIGGSRYSPESASVIKRTEFIPDLLSLRNNLGNLVNTLASVTVFTQEGDVVTAGGVTYRLLANEAPRIEGRQVACLHEAVR